MTPRAGGVVRRSAPRRGVANDEPPSSWAQERQAQRDADAGNGTPMPGTLRRAARRPQPPKQLGGTARQGWPRAAARQQRRRGAGGRATSARPPLDSASPWVGKTSNGKGDAPPKEQGSRARGQCLERPG